MIQQPNENDELRELMQSDKILEENRPAPTRNSLYRTCELLNKLAQSDPTRVESQVLLLHGKKYWVSYYQANREGLCNKFPHLDACYTAAESQIRNLPSFEDLMKQNEERVCCNLYRCID